MLPISAGKQALLLLDYLSNCCDLTPQNTELSENLSHFVSLTMPTETSDAEALLLNSFKQTGKINQLRTYLSLCEYNMEVYWGRQLTENRDKLQNFPYLRHYNSHINDEVALFKAHNINTQHIAWVGSGPFPLSAWLYTQQMNCHVTAIDISPEAQIIAQKASTSCGIANIDFLTAASQDVDYKNYDMIFVASLIEGKEATFDQIQKTNPNASIAVRTATGLREYLYESFDVNCNNYNLKLLGTTDYNPLHINQTHLLKPKT